MRFQGEHPIVSLYLAGPGVGAVGGAGGAVGRRVQVQKIHLHRPAWGGNADQITTHLGIKGFPEVE